MGLHILDRYGWLNGILKKQDAELYYYELQSQKEHLILREL
jgi:hypothetical protein